MCGLRTSRTATMAARVAAILRSMPATASHLVWAAEKEQVQAEVQSLEAVHMAAACSRDVLGASRVRQSPGILRKQHPPARAQAPKRVVAAQQVHERVPMALL